MRYPRTYSPTGDVPYYRLMLVRESEPPRDPLHIAGPKDVMRVCADLQDAPQERVDVLLLNTKNRLLARVPVFVGTLSSAPMAPRDIYQRALLANAACILLVHNHPSGDATPSGEDIQCAKRVREAGSMLGVEMLDFLVIGQGDCASLREMGLL